MVLLLAEDEDDEAEDELLDALDAEELLDEDPLPSPQAATVAIVPADANHTAPGGVPG
jgi:hypothetical protein